MGVKSTGRMLVILVCLLLVAGCGGGRATEPARTDAAPAAPEVGEETAEARPQPQSVADVAFHNGRVLTMEPGLPVEQALALQGDTILAVGSNDEILALAGEQTTVIDLMGRTLMPGFIDPHTHLVESAGQLNVMSREDAQQLAIENGITAIAHFASQEFVDYLRALEMAGGLRLRTSVYLYATGACGEPQGSWYRQYPPTRVFGEMLRINGVKIFADGGTCGYPAVTSETHPGAGQGDLWFTSEDLDALVVEAHEAGYQVAIHALGDRAIEQAQDAIVHATNGDNAPYRHRIEHSFYMRDDMMPRHGEFGIPPVIFGQFPTCSQPESERTEYWRETIRRWRELVDANPGLPIAAKSDTPYFGQSIPLVSLYNLTTLREVAEDGSVCSPPAWLAERAVTIEEALPMLTINAAYALFREEEVGSLREGKLADLIVLSGNPLDTAPESILDLEVWMTMIGGRTEYCASGHEDVCP
jgi:predicted amidohydrolase YtcJ